MWDKALVKYTLGIFQNAFSPPPAKNTSRFFLAFHSDKQVEFWR